MGLQEVGQEFWVEGHYRGPSNKMHTSQFCLLWSHGPNKPKLRVSLLITHPNFLLFDKKRKQMWKCSKRPKFLWRGNTDKQNQCIKRMQLPHDVLTIHCTGCSNIHILSQRTVILSLWKAREMAASFIFCNRGLVLMVLLTVTVTHSDGAGRVRLVEGPERKTVILGETTQLKCTVSIRTHYLVYMHWKHLASDMVYNDKNACSYTDLRVCVENHVDGDKFTTLLKIRNVTVEDAGTYSCEYAFKGRDVLNFSAAGNIAVCSPVTGPDVDPSDCISTTSTPPVTTKQQLQVLSPAVKIAVISASLFVGFVIGLVVILCTCKRRLRGMSAQQLDQAHSRKRNPTQDRAPVVFNKGGRSPTYENETPKKLGAQQSSCGGPVQKYQNTGPAIKPGFSSGAMLYENAPRRMTDNTYDDTVAQRAVPSSSGHTRVDQQVYMNHQV